MPASTTKANDLASRAVVAKDKADLKEDTGATPNRDDEGELSDTATEFASNGPNLRKRLSPAEIFNIIHKEDQVC